MKYKEGDIVRIKTYDELKDEVKHVWFSSGFGEISHHGEDYCIEGEMHQSLGGSYTIDKVNGDEYIINGTGCWQDWMIAYAEQVKPTITVNPAEDDVWGEHRSVNADSCEEATYGLHNHPKSMADFIMPEPIPAPKCLRDEFAMSALSGFLADVSGGTPREAGERAYQIADAMMEQRKL